jgi:hypothetical protein
MQVARFALMKSWPDTLHPGKFPQMINKYLACRAVWSFENTTFNITRYPPVTGRCASLRWELDDMSVVMFSSVYPGLTANFYRAFGETSKYGWFCYPG